MASVPIPGPQFNSSMYQAGTGFPYGGSIMYRGHVADSKYDFFVDSIDYDYIGTRFSIHAPSVVSNPSIVTSYLDQIYHLTNGGSYVSGQSTQGSSGGAAIPRPGSFTFTSPGAGYTSAPSISFTNAAHSATITAMQQSIIQQLWGSTPGSEPSYQKPDLLKPEGVKLGEIIGWRGWGLTDKGFLKSMSADVLWAPDEPMHGDIKSGAEHNGCYAYKRARDFIKAHESHLQVWGAVAMWGRVIEHEKGYRSEWAKIVYIKEVNGKQTKHTLSELRERYGVKDAKAPRTAN